MCGISMITVYPYAACLNCPWHLVQFMRITGPYTGTQPIKCVISNLDRFFGRLKGSHTKYGPENLFLEYPHFIMPLQDSWLYMITTFQPAVLMKRLTTTKHFCSLLFA